MLIISKFRDYYDASVGHGIDKTIVYERETTVVKSRDFFLDDYIFDDHNLDWIEGVKMLSYQWRIIGFCGKTYVLLIEKQRTDGGGMDFKSIEYFYGEDAFARVFHNRKKVRIFNSKSGILRYKETRDFIDKWHNRDFIDFFYQNKCPIFIVEPKRNWNQQSIEVFLNPSLTEYKFFQLFDSYTAFQEIQMFISGVIGINDPKTLEIDNQEKIRQHGFDLKWSFRNPDPPKRKQ